MGAAGGVGSPGFSLRRKVLALVRPPVSACRIASPGAWAAVLENGAGQVRLGAEGSPETRRPSAAHCPHLGGRPADRPQCWTGTWVWSLLFLVGGWRGPAHFPSQGRSVSWEFLAAGDRAVPEGNKCLFALCPSPGFSLRAGLSSSCSDPEVTPWSLGRGGGVSTGNSVDSVQWRKCSALPLPVFRSHLLLSLGEELPQFPDHGPHPVSQSGNLSPRGAGCAPHAGAVGKQGC